MASLRNGIAREWENREWRRYDPRTMPTVVGDQEDATPHTRCALISCVPVRSCSFALMENRQHLVDGAAGFFLDSCGIEARENRRQFLFKLLA